MKLATTLTALARLGPDYRFRTNFLADGTIDAGARKLTGDLVVDGAADPMFAAQDAQDVAAELTRLGVGHVTGALRITGPFYFFATGYHSNLSRETSAAKLRGALQAAGIHIDGQTVFGEKSGTPLVSHYSEQLLHILFYQNAHSSNAIAEVVRDLYRSEAQPEQSYSERQLYEAALDRMMREIAAVQKLSEPEAFKVIDAQLKKNTKRGVKPDAAEGEEVEEAA